MNQDKTRKAWQWLVREWIRPVLPVLILLTAVRSAVADWNDVPTGSMNPSILEGDRVFVNKLAYSVRFPLTRWHLAEFDGPRRGDIVVFISPHDGKRLIKRVVGVAGDTIEMQDNRLWLNGTPIEYELPDADARQTIAPTMPPAWPIAVEQLPDHPHVVMTKPQVGTRRSFSATPVRPGHVFVMGDSRDDSFDSRYFGTVDRQRILGEATHVVMSLDPERHHLPRWNRFFSRLP